MIQEWDKVKHEVQLMAGLLRALRDDLSAANNSGALTESQVMFVKTVGAWAMGTAVLVEASLKDATKDETVEEGETG